MKKSLLCCMVIVSQFFRMHATTQEPEITKEPIVNAPPGMVIISPRDIFINTMFINIMNEHLSSAYREIKIDEALITKGNTAAILLQGLAQSCMHLGSIFGAESSKEKQQGMLNVAGTVFAVAAQLAAHSPKPAQQPVLIIESTQTQEPAQVQKSDPEMVSKLAVLTDCLMKECKPEQFKNPANFQPMLALIRSYPDAEKREALISFIIASPSYAEQYLNELFSTLYAYAYDSGSILTDFIKDKISYYLDHQSETPEIINAQNQDSDTRTPNIIVRSQKRSAEPEELDYLTNRFIGLLQDQLKLALGIDQSATTLQMINELHEGIKLLHTTR